MFLLPQHLSLCTVTKKNEYYPWYDYTHQPPRDLAWHNVRSEIGILSVFNNLDASICVGTVRAFPIFKRQSDKDTFNLKIAEKGVCTKEIESFVYNLNICNVWIPSKQI